jgi:crotonobetainyl-CoA:carnitine CoA-transferase CaiB-like acyl-CoA transferase
VEFRKHPTEHWLKVLGGVLPVAPVYELAKALDSPFLRTTDMIKITSRTRAPRPARARQPDQDQWQAAIAAGVLAGGADTEKVLG